jgi:general stress protein 26
MKGIIMSNLQSKIIEAFGPRPMMSLATLTEDGKPWVRYVMGQISDDLTIRFSTFLPARKVAQIRKNPEVHITCGVSSLETARHYVQVQGQAEICRDEKERHSFWNEGMRAYYSGPDDPNYCIVIVRPYRIEYYSMGTMKPEVWSI